MSNNLSAALQAIAQQNKPAQKDQIAVIREKLQAAIKSERLAQGLTQKKLAYKCSMSQATITRAEKRGWISFWALIKIADALGKTISLT